MIDRCCDHAAAIFKSVVGLPGATEIARLVREQGLPRLDAADGGNISDAVIAASNKTLSAAGCATAIASCGLAFAPGTPVRTICHGRPQ